MALCVSTYFRFPDFVDSSCPGCGSNLYVMFLDDLLQVRNFFFIYTAAVALRTSTLLVSFPSI